MQPPRIGTPIFRLEMQSDVRDERQSASEGWVYLVKAGQGMAKVGRARNPPRSAARDWKPNVIAYAAVPDRYKAEAMLHQLLADRRVVGSKLYRIGTTEAAALLRDHFGEVRVVPPSNL